MKWQFLLCFSIVCLGFIRAELPKQWDWRQKNVVTKVKDQGNCTEGDWAFAAIGVLEGLLATNGYNLTDLSEQELIDCTKVTGNFGCQAGTVERAFDYIEENGISAEQSYPYTGQDANVCRNKLEEKLVKSKDIQIMRNFIGNNDEQQMKSTLYRYGPILAIIDASQESFSNYASGIYKDEECGKSGEHNVLIVGYGETEQGEKYWIVKNSWGEKWGEKGYIRIARGKNTCGIATTVTFLTLDKLPTPKLTILPTRKGSKN